MAWKPEHRGTAATYGADYRRKRLECLRRAGWRCEIRLPGVCIGSATQADHIDQARNDPRHEHLRAACEPCHLRVTAQQGAGARSSRAAPDPQPLPFEW